MDSTEVRVRIAKIIPAEKKKPGYVVTYPTHDMPEIRKEESITFSLDQWQGPGPPQVGQIAFLKGVQNFVGGWRATEARPSLLSEVPVRASRD